MATPPAQSVGVVALDAGGADQVAEGRVSALGMRSARKGQQGQRRAGAGQLQHVVKSCPDLAHFPRPRPHYLD